MPAVENGCRNGIHRRRRAPKQYEKVRNEYKNNNLTRFYFKLTITSYLAMVTGNNKSETTKNAGKLLAISIAIQMRQYDTGRIA